MTDTENTGGPASSMDAPSIAPSEGAVADGIGADDDMGGFARRALKRALAIAWMAALLGIVVQSLVLVVRLWAGADFVVAQFLASAAQGISWSVLVCGAVAIGTVAGRARAAITGLIGLIAGPLAWGVAKGAQKGVQAMLAMPQDKITDFFVFMSFLKGVEYAILGALLGYMVGRKWATLWAHVALGVVLGAVFASGVVALNLQNAAASGKPMPFPAVAGLATNEFVFPIGCSLVIYAVQRLRGHVESVQKRVAK
jgi:hypothetical protein